MGSPYLKTVDSSEFEARFSSDNRIKYDEVRSSGITFEEMEPLLDRLPPREKDLIYLYCHYKKNQKDIAKMFGVTQGAVSSRLARARRRLLFLRDIPKISSEDIDKELTEYFDSIEVEIIKCMVITTCQSRTAFMVNKKFGFTEEKKRMTQVKVRHRFEKCIDQLENLINKRTDLKKYYNLLKLIRDNLYILHEVKLPHFDRGNMAVFSLHTD